MLTHVDHVLKEYHFLLTCFEPDQGPKGSLQRSLAVVILSAIDGAAQVFWPDRRLRPGDRFKEYVKANFPWELDKPKGLTKILPPTFCMKISDAPLSIALGQRVVRVTGASMSGDTRSVTPKLKDGSSA